MDMDEEERIFHLSIFYAQDINRIILRKKREKETKAMKRRTSGMRRRVKK